MMKQSNRETWIQSCGKKNALGHTPKTFLYNYDSEDLGQPQNRCEDWDGNLSRNNPVAAEEDVDDYQL